MDVVQEEKRYKDLVLIINHLDPDPDARAKVTGHLLLPVSLRWKPDASIPFSMGFFSVWVKIALEPQVELLSITPSKGGQGITTHESC